MAKTFLLFLVFSIIAHPQSKRPSVVLEGGAASVTVDLGGGSIVDFHLREQPLNPLTWLDKSEPSAPRAMGHFVCLDRWGQPSAAELKNGMPFHGEASKSMWRVVRQPSRVAGGQEAVMAVTLPMAGMTAERRIRLREDAAVFTVTEAVTNTNKLGRVYNMVQHPTIAAPFLDESTMVDSNARRGLMQTSPLPNPEEPSVWWPQALKDSQPIDMRRLTSDDVPSVVSYVMDEDLGWVTACTPAKGLLIGYIWKTADYPWFSAWRYSQDGKPNARGLEFGTTGLHQPFPVLVRKGQIFGRPIFSYLDAGETASRSYAAFLLKTRPDYRGVARVTYSAGKLVVLERGGGEMTINSGELW